MHEATLFKNGLIYIDGKKEPLEFLVQDGLVVQAGPSLSFPGAAIQDLRGYLVSPGFVDIHTHLRDPGFPQKETIRTGTLAAAAGGFTTVCAMPNLNPVPDTAAHLSGERSLIERYAQVEVLPYAAITLGEGGETLCDFASLAPDCVAFSDDGKGVQSDALMLKAMEGIKAAEGLLCAHCEDDALVPQGGCVHDGVAARRFEVPGIPSASEWRQVRRDLRLVAKTGVRYHVCHVSCKETVSLVRQAKREGLPVTCECTPHQLMLCDEDIAEDSGRYKMNPPLRSRADRDAIIAGLLDGAIDCIATDHAPHTAEEKDKGLSGSVFGVVGLETAFSVCYTSLVRPGFCTLPFLLEKLTEAPARVIGRDCGFLYEGGPASFAVLDTDVRVRVAPETFKSKGRATPFEGMALYGEVVSTWFQGKNVYERGV